MNADHTPQTFNPRSAQAARRSAAASPIRKVPTRIIAASSRMAGDGSDACCTATVPAASAELGVVRSPPTGATPSDAKPASPANARDTSCLRMSPRIRPASSSSVPVLQTLAGTSSRVPVQLCCGIREKTRAMRFLPASDCAPDYPKFPFASKGAVEVQLLNAPAYRIVVPWWTVLECAGISFTRAGVR